MQKNNETSRIKKLSRFLVAVLVIALVTGGTWYLIDRYQKKKDREDAVATMMFFEGRLRFLTADEAAKEWQLAKAEIRIPLRCVPSCEEWDPYYRLGSKYFKEERCDSAFKMYKKVFDTGGPINENFLIYLAGLAGRKHWLQKQIMHESSNNQRLRNAFIKANIEWASGNYDAVIMLADRQSYDSTTQSSGKSEELLAWLGFIKAQTLIKLGKDDQAYGILVEEVAPVMSRVRPDKSFVARMAIIIARVAERTGRYQDALLFAEVADRYFKGRIDPSWDKDRKLIDEMIIRLRDKEKSVVVPTENSEVKEVKGTEHLIPPP